MVLRHDVFTTPAGQVATWNLMPCLGDLVDEADATYPQRATVSDGTIGDAAHQAKVSDHNPAWLAGYGWVVTAVDLTTPMASPGRPTLSAWDLGNRLVDQERERLRLAHTPRVKYVIAMHPDGQDRIWNFARGDTAWRLNGSARHDKHVHTSGLLDVYAMDAPGAWGIAPVSEPEVIDMASCEATWWHTPAEIKGAQPIAWCEGRTRKITLDAGARMIDDDPGTDGVKYRHTYTLPVEYSPGAHITRLASKGLMRPVVVAWMSDGRSYALRALRS